MVVFVVINVVEIMLGLLNSYIMKLDVINVELWGVFVDDVVCVG